MQTRKAGGQQNNRAEDKRIPNCIGLMQRDGRMTGHIPERLRRGW